MAAIDLPSSTMRYEEDPNLPGYWSYDGLRIQAAVETHQFVVAFARAHFPAGTPALDVATGEGALAKQLLDQGFRVSCTSWNDKCRVAASMFRIDLDHPFSLDDVGGRPFPLVCGIEIIEHVENPAAFLRSCASLLAPDGYLLVSTPNVESAAARLQWLVHGCPATFGEEEIVKNRHITLMWRQGLEYMIARAGLRIVERHFLGGFRLKPGPLSLVKHLLYRFMHLALGPETRGNARLYVLAPAGKPPSKVGPESVY